VKLSVIVPARNELFLSKTVDDLFVKASEDIEVIVVLDGYWPETELFPKENKNLRYIHFGKSRGLRAGTNAAVAIATGKYIMKVDAHCLFAEGFDKALKADCEPNWVVVPRRYALDAENWCKKSKHPIDYLYCETPSEKNRWEINVRVWSEKNYDKELQKKLIDDVFTFQGSCWFMHRDYYYELELMDSFNYGSFRKEPQEITFKAWCSGGRAVRNKNTWYAHLHKGKRYGRGYRPSKSDWRKGDEYLLGWLTDSAWDKQTKSFRWMIEQFDMPMWDSFDWNKYPSKLGVISKPELEPEPEPKLKPVPTALYQNIPMDGVISQNPKKNNSKFWNEGKWQNFIAPHLPDDATDQAFVEMGCNAGLFLKMAEDYGFRNVVGIEKNKTPALKGNEYRDQIGYNYKLLKRSLGGQFGNPGNFDFEEIPVADYTIMSTFHYYVDINSWWKYLDKLRGKSKYILFVSRPTMRHRHWRASSPLEDLKKYLPEWKMTGFIDGVSQKGDPSPRNLFSVLFENPLLERIPIEDIDIRESTDDTMYLAMGDLAKHVTENPNIDVFDTDYYHKWVERKKGKWSEKFIRCFVQNKFNMMVSVKEIGIKDPLIVDNENKLCDGGHRLAILKALGYKSVIVRETC